MDPSWYPSCYWLYIYIYIYMYILWYYNIVSIQSYSHTVIQSYSHIPSCLAIFPSCSLYFSKNWSLPGFQGFDTRLLGLCAPAASCLIKDLTHPQMTELVRLKIMNSQIYVNIINILIGGLEHVLLFHILTIIPTDELMFFRGVGIPPTRHE